MDLPKRRRPRKNPLTHEQILQWADAHRRRTGEWPTIKSGGVHDHSGENWLAISGALRSGSRRLPGGTSLARLLFERRGAKNRCSRQTLSLSQVLAWADSHHRRTGQWPYVTSGPVWEQPDESWRKINRAFGTGTRGLPPEASLVRLLQKHRGKRNPFNLPRLTHKQILRWADAHYRRTGSWPGFHSGPVPGMPGETWGAIFAAMNDGRRGLRGGPSLAQLLKRHRHVSGGKRRPPLTLRQIVKCARIHRARTGSWPRQTSGAVIGAPGEDWWSITYSIRFGRRGLARRDTLPRVLSRYCGHRNRCAIPPLSEAEIIRWARRHRAETGRWPNTVSGPVIGVRGESWQKISAALRGGLRGLPGGESLAHLLARHCTGIRKRAIRA